MHDAKWQLVDLEAEVGIYTLCICVVPHLYLQR